VKLHAFEMGLLFSAAMSHCAALSDTRIPYKNVDKCVSSRQSPVICARAESSVLFSQAQIIDWRTPRAIRNFLSASFVQRLHKKQTKEKGG
jgi:hypothetical protein